MIMKYRAALLVWLIFLLIVPDAVLADMDVVFLDVGAGDCTLFVADGQVMLVDTAETMANFQHMQNVFAHYGIDRIDVLVLTHPHVDHIGNAGNIIRDYEVGAVLLAPIEHDTKVYDDLVMSIVSSGIDIVYLNVGDVIALGEAEITIYGPHPVVYQNVNNWSIVLMVRYGGMSILMTADIEAEAESDLLSYDGLYPLKADILKVPHHGSNTSSTYPFIQAVSPDFAVVSCASASTNDDLHDKTAMTLNELGVSEIFNTEMLGDIELTITRDGEFTLGMADWMDDAA